MDKIATKKTAELTCAWWNNSFLTAYPAIAGGAAKDQLRGRREFVY